MKLFERTNKGSGKFKKKRQTDYDPVAIWLNGTDAQNILLPAGFTPVSKNEEVKKCIHKIADLVSSMTIFLMQNNPTGDVRLKNALSKKVDIYPNNNMTRKNFIYKIVVDMISTGNSVIFPKIKNGLLDNLIIWDANSVSFQGDEEDYSFNL